MRCCPSRRALITLLLAVGLIAHAQDQGAGERVGPTGLAVGAAGASAVAPAPLPHGIIVKLRPGARVCPSCSVDAGQTLGVLASSSRLDELNRRFGVHRTHPLVRHAAGAATGRALAGRLATRARRGLGAAPDFTRTYVFEMRTHPNLAEVAREYAADPAVEYAEPDWIVRTALVPDDPFFATRGSWGQPFEDLWGLERIRAPEAWDVTRGAGVVIAVTDTGIDYSHPDLAANVWTNTGEIPGNGIDDDGNGYVDDLRGWDFVDDDPDPLDDNGHGTHVAGTAAAVGQNGRGILGVAFESRVMAVRGLDTWGSGTTSGLAEAILYAVDNGADVINASWAGRGHSETVAEAIAAAHAAGVVFVTAAGNSDEDTAGTFPANDPNAITVAAFAGTDVRAEFSNFGVKLDLGAPGGGDPAPPEDLPEYSILSLRSGALSPYVRYESALLLNDGTAGYLRLAGTSMAAPHVAGAAALVVAAHPAWGVEQVRQALRIAARDVAPPGPDDDSGYGVLDAAAALAAPEPIEAHVAGPRAGELVGPTLVEIHGTAAGPGFERYTVEYRPAADPFAWTTIAGPVDTPVKDGALATWDMSGLTDGAYVLRLRVERGTEVFTDRVPLSVRNIAIEWPERLAALRADTPVQIRGTAAGGGFTRWTLEVRRPALDSAWGRVGLTLAAATDEPVHNGLFGTIDVSGLTEPDRFDFRLTVENGAGTLEKVRLGVTVDPTLRLGWPQWLVGLSDREYLTVADLDADGMQEILVGSGQEVVVFEPDGSMRPGWPQSVRVDSLSGRTRGSPLVADVAGDGAPEVIATNHREIFVWSAGGVLVPGFPVTVDVLAHGGNQWIGAGDLDGDGKDEIICTGLSAGLRAYRGDGTMLPWGSSLKRNMPPAIGDVFGDGRVEVAWFHALEGRTPASMRRGLVTLLGPDSDVLAEARIKGAFFTHAAMADVDGDGTLDIVVVNEPIHSSRVHLRAFSPLTGLSARLRGPRLVGPQRSGNAFASFSDLDHDGRAEAWVYLRVVDKDDPRGDEKGTFAPFEVRHVPNPKPPIIHQVIASLVFTDKVGGIAIGDVDGDGVQELLAGVVGVGCGLSDQCPLGTWKIRRAVPAQRPDGSFLAGFPKAVPDHLSVEDGDGSASITWFDDDHRFATPAIADLDGDGLKEVIWVDTLGPRLFVWNVAGTPGPLVADWPMYKHDAKHSYVFPPTAR